MIVNFIIQTDGDGADNLVPMVADVLRAIPNTELITCEVLDDRAPLCPVCSLHIANCEGHTSTITKEPDSFREELQAAEEFDKLLNDWP